MDNQQTENTDTSTAAANGQVMDVTAPSQHIDVSDASSESQPTSGASTEEATSDSDQASPSAETTSEPASEDSAPEADSAPDSAPGTPEPASTTTSASENEPTSPETSEPASSPTSETNGDTPASPLLHATPAHAKGGKPIVAIIAAIIVGVALAGLVIFVYMKQKNNGDIKRTDTTAASSQTVVAKPQASTSDVDTANQTIDDNLKKADDNKDFPSASLTDTSLGL